MRCGNRVILPVGASTTRELRCSFPLDEMRMGVMVFFYLFSRNNTAAEVCELHKLMLNPL